jgi:hypothetical protein
MSADTRFDNRTLSFLDISNNDICKKVLGPEKVDIKASEGDIVEFNGAQGVLATWNDIKFGFVPLSGVQAIATAITDMGALSTLTFSGERDRTGIVDAHADYSNNEPITMETTMTEADFSGKELGASGGMMVAAFLPKCQ